jgi:hypothetical protein
MKDSGFVDFAIREAELSDLEDIVELWKDLSADQLGKDKYYKGSLEFNGGHKQIKNSILSDDCGIFVVEYDNRIQGFIEVWINNDSFQLQNNDCAYILHYYVNQNSRKIGNIFAVITRLYKVAENFAKLKGKSYVIADAFEHNQRIIRLLKIEEMFKYKTRMVREI